MTLSEVCKQKRGNAIYSSNVFYRGREARDISNCSIYQYSGILSCHIGIPVVEIGFANRAARRIRRIAASFDLVNKIRTIAMRRAGPNTMRVDGYVVYNLKMPYGKNLRDFNLLL